MITLANHSFFKECHPPRMTVTTTKNTKAGSTQVQRMRYVVVALTWQQQDGCSQVTGSNWLQASMLQPHTNRRTLIFQELKMGLTQHQTPPRPHPRTPPFSSMHTETQLHTTSGALHNPFPHSPESKIQIPFNLSTPTPNSTTPHAIIPAALPPSDSLTRHDRVPVGARARSSGARPHARRGGHGGGCASDAPAPGVGRGDVRRTGGVRAALRPDAGAFFASDDGGGGRGGNGGGGGSGGGRGGGGSGGASGSGAGRLCIT